MAFGIFIFPSISGDDQKNGSNGASGAATDDNTLGTVEPVSGSCASPTDENPEIIRLKEKVKEYEKRIDELELENKDLRDKLEKVKPESNDTEQENGE